MTNKMTNKMINQDSNLPKKLKDSELKKILKEKIKSDNSNPNKNLDFNILNLIIRNYETTIENKNLILYYFSNKNDKNFILIVNEILKDFENGNFNDGNRMVYSICGPFLNANIDNNINLNSNKKQILKNFIPFIKKNLICSSSNILSSILIYNYFPDFFINEILPILENEILSKKDHEFNFFILFVLANCCHNLEVQNIIENIYTDNEKVCLLKMLRNEIKDQNVEICTNYDNKNVNDSDNENVNVNDNENENVNDSDANNDSDNVSDGSCNVWSDKNTKNMKNTDDIKKDISNMNNNNLNKKSKKKEIYWIKEKTKLFLISCLTSSIPTLSLFAAQILIKMPIYEYFVINSLKIFNNLEILEFLYFKTDFNQKVFIYEQDTDEIKMLKLRYLLKIRFYDEIMKWFFPFREFIISEMLLKINSRTTKDIKNINIENINIENIIKDVDKEEDIKFFYSIIKNSLNLENKQKKDFSLTLETLIKQNNILPIFFLSLRPKRKNLFNTIKILRISLQNENKKIENNMNILKLFFYIKKSNFILNFNEKNEMLNLIVEMIKYSKKYDCDLNEIVDFLDEYEWPKELKQRVSILKRYRWKGSSQVDISKKEKELIPKEDLIGDKKEKELICKEDSIRDSKDSIIDEKKSILGNKEIEKNSDENSENIRQTVESKKSYNLIKNSNDNSRNNGKSEEKELIEKFNESLVITENNRESDKNSDTFPNIKLDTSSNKNLDISLNKNPDISSNIKLDTSSNKNPDISSNIKLDTSSNKNLDTFPNTKLDASSNKNLDTSSNIKLDTSSNKNLDTLPNTKSDENKKDNLETEMKSFGLKSDSLDQKLFESLKNENNFENENLLEFPLSSKNYEKMNSNNTNNSKNRIHFCNISNDFFTGNIHIIEQKNMNNYESNFENNSDLILEIKSLKLKFTYSFQNKIFLINKPQKILIKKISILDFNKNLNIKINKIYYKINLDIKYFIKPLEKNKIEFDINFKNLVELEIIPKKLMIGKNIFFVDDKRICFGIRDFEFYGVFENENVLLKGKNKKLLKMLKMSRKE